MRIVCLLIATLALGGLTLPPASVIAQSTPALQITVNRDDIHVSLQGASIQGGTDLSTIPGLQPIAFHGIQLPGQLVALRVDDGATGTPTIKQLTSVPWTGSLKSVAAPIPTTSDGEQHSDLAEQPSQSLPDAPIVIFRQGSMRGVRIVVLLVSPLFEQNGVQRLVTNLDAVVLQTSLFNQDTASILAQSAPFLAAAPPPSNPAASVPSATLRVTQVGIQQVTGAALATTGLNLADSSKLHLYHNGIEVAIELRDGGDGKLDAADELRFFATPPGDRWNAADLYWLTVEATPGLRMATRAAQTVNTPSRDTAYQSGIWRNNTLYDSTLPGPDQDHWFAIDLKTGPGLPSKSTLVTLQRGLPLAAGTTTLVASGSAYTSGQHQLTISQGIAQVFLPLVISQPSASQIADVAVQAISSLRQTLAAPALVVWSGKGNWSHTFTFESTIAMAQVTLVAGAIPDGVELDNIAWRRPVELIFGEQGALFETDAGAASYRLRETAAGRTLYDVTDANRPALISIPDGATTIFQDDPAAHHYALSGPGLLWSPTVAAHTPVDLAPPLNADALYIAPVAFGPALASLVSLRTGQGYAVRVVDVQTIYDVWSFGAVSPEAIRSFLRYAAATWSRIPRAVTLVGDGTIDPFNYYGHNGNGLANNVNLIPPYVAMADPWAGETACETCYGLLDNDNPLLDTLPDLAVGRLPVKTLTELEQLVKKLVMYETRSLGPSLHTRSVYLADNYREADGTADDAGDFAAFADSSIALQPAGTEIARVYYDPSPSHIGVPWREADPTTAARRSREEISAGADLVNYFGHSNQFQLAVTNNNPQDGPGYLLRLYDADALTNGNHLPIMLEMTCLTSAFQTPALSGTTIDERLILAPGGGAAAVWGSTGRGVSFGHDYLQAGFYGALWQAVGAGTTPAVGTLTTAGYQNLFTQGKCCQESINTFALLGDPLMIARVRGTP